MAPQAAYPLRVVGVAERRDHVETEADDDAQPCHPRHGDEKEECETGRTTHVEYPTARPEGNRDAPQHARGRQANHHDDGETGQDGAELRLRRAHHVGPSTDRSDRPHTCSAGAAIMWALVPRGSRITDHPGILTQTGPRHVPTAVHLALLLTQRKPVLGRGPTGAVPVRCRRPRHRASVRHAQDRCFRSGPTTQPCIPRLGLLITPHSPVGVLRDEPVPARRFLTDRVLRD